MRSRIMYIEDKSEGLANAGRIGRVTFSKAGATLRYAGRAFQSLKGSGFKANYFDVETGVGFWISGPRRDGADGLYGRLTQPEDVDIDVAEAYWRDIRGMAHPDAAILAKSTPSSPPAPSLSETAIAAWGRKQSRVAGIVARRTATDEA